MNENLSHKQRTFSDAPLTDARLSASDFGDVLGLGPLCSITGAGATWRGVSFVTSQSETEHTQLAKLSGA